MRNPWKIKDIPFGDKPTMICSLNVQMRSDNQLSICIVSTINLYFSKFMCFYSVAQDLSQLNTQIFQLIQQSVDKFCLTQKIYPFRVFIFRTGMIPDFYNENAFMQAQLIEYYRMVKNTKMNSLTYVRFNKSHPIRTYKQFD